MLKSFTRSRSYSRPKGHMKVRSYIQASEFSRITDVITHSPSIATKFPFHLDAFLFSAPPNPLKAVECHNGFCQAIEQLTGATVWRVEEVLKQLPEEKLISILLDQAKPKFQIDPDLDESRFTEEFKKEYFQNSLSELSKDHLIDLLLLNPSVTIRVDKSSTGFSYDTIPVSPLSNLVFTRDQQIATMKGVVMGRMGMIQRRNEVNIMSIVLQQLKIPIIGQITNPGIMNGGDFMPINKDLALIGVGSRTNLVGAQQLIDMNAVGTSRIAIIEGRKRGEHLDSVVNFLNEETVVVLKEAAKDVKAAKKLVHEYVKTEDGQYGKVRTCTLGEWLNKEKLNVIEITAEEQAQFFTEFLHLGRDNHGKDMILTGNSDFAQKVQREGFEGEVHTIDFSAVLAMHGGPHASAFCLRAEE